ncbi:MAG: hypothetical protein IT222_06695, partial [Crocinitomix sp.]|nr:hypothetical protein [Crocinitomix sp.]
MKILAIFFLMFIFKGALSQPCPSPLITYVYYNEDNTIHFTATPGFDSYLWIPSEDFPDPTISDPIIPYVGTDEYTVITTWVGPELVLNGDFSLGNTEFLSDLDYSIIYTPGNYYVGNTFFATGFAEDDHSPSADGMFMSVDGSYLIETLWEQTISVIEENTDYQFSFWATPGGTINPPYYEIHLIGDVTGDEIIATLDGYTDTAYWYWINYPTPIWNSGMNNTVTVRIINLETNGYGNDFGLDDFSFRNVCIDTTKINISTTISILSNNVSCFGACDGTAEVEYEGDSFYSYLWDEAAGGGVESSVTGLCPGTYSVSITDEFGLVVILYATITEPPPLLLSEFGYDPAYCRLFDYQSGNGVVFGAATGGTPDYTYKWTNLETGDWVSNTTWGGLNPGIYEFTVTDKNGCVLTQLIEVDSLNPIADFTITLDQLKTDCDAVIPVDIMFTNNSL